MDRITHAEKSETADADGCEADDSGALRCLCGSLMARRVAGGIELKCRRCKRTMVMALEPAEEACAGD
jgi:hypothetical protein